MIRKTAEYIRIPKKIFWSIIIIAVVGLTLWSIKPERQQVDQVHVEQGLFQKTVVDEAITQFTKKQIITAPADGITPHLNLKAGDPIQKGQILLDFDWDISFKLKAPFDGFVLRVFEKDKRHVPRGTPLLEVGSPEELEVIAKILSDEVVGIQVGQPVVITDWGENEPLQGSVRKIEKSAVVEVSALGVKEQRVPVYIEITSPREKWKTLGDGFRVEISIITSETPEARLIPVGALFENEGQPAVFVIENKKITMKTIKVKDRNRKFAHGDESLPVGTPLVLYPGPQLSEGTRVQLRK